MIYPYMNTLNLSVDNALTSQQIIHQLITKTNEIVETVNHINDEFTDEYKTYTDEQIKKTTTDFENKITELNKELLDIDKVLKEYIERAIKSGREYTDLKTEDLQNAIEKNKNRIEDVLKESKLYTDDKVKVANTEIQLLSDKLDLLVKNSVAVISPLDGSTKKATDAMYDMLHVFQRKNSITLDNIIAMLLYVSDTNAPPDGILMGSNMDTMLHYAREGGLNAFYKPLRNQLITSGYSGYTEQQMVPPTWGNIVSCGIYALMSLGKPGYVNENTGPFIRPLGGGTVMYNCYYNKSDTDGYTQFVKVTGTEFKPFDITKL